MLAYTYKSKGVFQFEGSSAAFGRTGCHCKGEFVKHMLQ